MMVVTKYPIDKFMVEMWHVEFLETSHCLVEITRINIFLEQLHHLQHSSPSYYACHISQAHSAYHWLGRSWATCTLCDYQCPTTTTILLSNDNNNNNIYTIIIYPSNTYWEQALTLRSQLGS